MHLQLHPSVINKHAQIIEYVTELVLYIVVNIRFEKEYTDPVNTIVAITEWWVNK